MKLIKGKKIADGILRNIKREIKKEKLGIGLAVILVGEDEASKIYTRLKKKAAEKVGINFFEFRFANVANVETRLIASLQEKIINKINQLNRDKKINGIIIQLPLPKGLDTRKIISSVNPRKDADGFHPENIKLFFRKKEKIWPVFPKAIIKTLESAGVKLDGKKAVITANSEKFGEIMMEALRRKNIKARYVLAGNIKKNLPIIKRSDIIISACGIPGLIKGEMIKKGAVIVDGGITKKGKKILGDVDIKSVENIAGYTSPVPGGVGPVTVACLLENVLILSQKEIPI